MKRMLFSFALLLGVLSAKNASAAQTLWTAGNIGYLSCFGNGTCSVTLTSTAPTFGSCVTSGNQSFYVSSTTATGAALVKQLSAAKAAGWTVKLYGYTTPQCTVQSGYEDLYWVQSLP